VSARSDQELWRRTAAGDGDAFGALYDRHARAIYNYCFRRTADWAAAEDLTSLVFLEAWRKRFEVRFTGEGGVLGWLYGVANNVLRNHERASRRLLRFVARAATWRSALPGADLEQRVVDEERMRAILETLKRLPRAEREVLVICVLGGASYADAALALGIPHGTVRSRLFEARRRLRELVAAAGHGVTEEDEDVRVPSAGAPRASP
jgi:RNA polymerase sigma-70 factor (ECF subfamily)